MTPQGNSVAMRVGRLLELRVDQGYATVADVDTMFDEVDRVVAKLVKAERHVTVVDWRGCPVMSPMAASRFAERIVLTNRRTDRSAGLINRDSPVAVLQFLRVVRESHLDDRRLFFEEKKLVDWLAGVLRDVELRRLREFLKEGAAARGNMARTT